jgi:hypothetical protein
LSLNKVKQREAASVCDYRKTWIVSWDNIDKIGKSSYFLQKHVFTIFFSTSAASEIAILLESKRIVLTSENMYFSLWRNDIFQNEEKLMKRESWHNLIMHRSIIIKEFENTGFHLISEWYQWLEGKQSKWQSMSTNNMFPFLLKKCLCVIPRLTLLTKVFKKSFKSNISQNIEKVSLKSRTLIIFDCQSNQKKFIVLKIIIISNTSWDLINCECKSKEIFS